MGQKINPNGFRLVADSLDCQHRAEDLVAD